MKNKSIKLEDDEDSSYEKPFVKMEKSIKKKRNKENNENLNASTVNNPDDDVFIESILMDFKNFGDLNKFKNMKSLSLINQGISNIEVIDKIIRYYLVNL